MHSTFLIVLGWVALTHFLDGHSLAATINGVLFILILFGIVVLHELGHALSARRYGIRTRNITLLPIGGVARRERMADNPKQKLVVALVGPALNVVLAIGLFILLVTVSGIPDTNNLTLVEGNFFARVMALSIVLAVFNLLPAFPMDGGRVLRAVLGMKMDDNVQTKQIADYVGQAIPILFGIGGLLVFDYPLLIFIAFFVWIGAAEEASMVQMKSALGGIPIRQAMITDFQMLSPDDMLQQTDEHILEASNRIFHLTRTGV